MSTRPPESRHAEALSGVGSLSNVAAASCRTETSEAVDTSDAVDNALRVARDAHRQRMVIGLGLVALFAAGLAIVVGGSLLQPVDRVVLGLQALLGLVVAISARRGGTTVGLVTLCVSTALGVGWFQITRPDSLLAIMLIPILFLLWVSAGPERFRGAALVASVVTILAFRVGRFVAGTESDFDIWFSITFDSLVMMAGVGVVGVVDRARADREGRMLRTALIASAQQEVAARELRDLAERSASAASAASEAKSDFLARISHELRTPLNAILGYSELIDEDEDTPAFVKSDTAKIQVAGRHLLSLVDQVLDLSKVEAGRMDLLIEALPVSELIDPVLVTVRPLLTRNGNRLTVQSDAVPGVMVALDAGRVRQVLLNLLSNAARFTKDGDVNLMVGLNHGDFVAQVTDNGIGIRPERLPHLFQPFVQAERDTSYKYGGTGLGLALCERIVRSMGGRIDVDSAVGKGSRFTVVIPLSTTVGQSSPATPSLSAARNP